MAGQTVTFSVWLTADSARTISAELSQLFGSGGSGTVGTSLGSFSVTTSWTRFTATVAVPSISGKTIGAGSLLLVRLFLPLNTVMTIDTWGWQLEAGSVATPFQTATGTIQGELAAAQRYYYLLASGTDKPIGVGFYNGATNAQTVVKLPVTMRTNPTLSATTGTNYYQLTTGGVDDPFNSLTIFNVSTDNVHLYNNTEASGTNGTAGMLKTINASASIAFSAEL